MALSGINEAEAARCFLYCPRTLGNALAPVNFLIGLGVLGAILSATRLSSLGRGLMITAAVLLVGGRVFTGWKIAALSA